MLLVLLEVGSIGRINFSLGTNGILVGIDAAVVITPRTTLALFFFLGCCFVVCVPSRV